MRASILAGLLMAAFILPAAAEVRPVQGTYNVTASAAKGAVYGTGNVVKGAARRGLHRHPRQPLLTPLSSCPGLARAPTILVLS